MPKTNFDHDRSRKNLMLFCSFKVPEHVQMTDTLAEKLHRLVQLNVHMG